MSKMDLKIGLKHIKNSYLVGCLSIALLEKTENESLPNKIIIEIHEHDNVIELKPIKELLKIKQNQSFIYEEFIKTSLRSFIRETYESVKDYSKITNQYNKIANSDLMRFTRLIRNALAHNFTFKFENKDMNRLPIKWRNRAITPDLDGKKVDWSIMDFNTSIVLHEDVNIFVENELV